MALKTKINVRNASLEFPIHNSSSGSLKNTFVKAIAGGVLKKDTSSNAILVKALNRINLNIKEGERIGLIGHNGAGKSTLLRLLSNIYQPSSGHVSVNGTVTSLININLGIDQECTGIENIIIRGKILGITNDKLPDYIKEVVEFSELGDFIHLPFRTYSSGMRLRLAFAASTIIAPDILIFDEWLSTGDRLFKEKSNKHLKKLVDDSKVMVIASHSIQLIKNMCTRVIWLDKGSIKMDGDVNSVITLYNKE